jgi:hypothetical protein
MSLFIPGVQRGQALTLSTALVLIVTTMFFGAPKASAAEGEPEVVPVVSVSPGETSCYYMQRTVLNPTDQWVAAMSYEIRNDVREDYPDVELIPPRGEHNFKTDQRHYFKHELGVLTVALTGGPGSLPVGDWQDWKPAEYVLSADECPQMVAEPKLMKRWTGKATLYKRPTIWVKTTAYRADFGYRIGKKRKIRWLSRGVNPGFGPVYGPAISFGKVKRVQVCWRTRDDAGEKSERPSASTSRCDFKRVHGYP